MSRKNLPKQFLELAGKGTLFQQAVARTLQLPHVAAPIVVASEDHRFLAADQLLEAGIEGATIVLEPLTRNTAPAIALGALQALQRDADAVLLVLPAAGRSEHSLHRVVHRPWGKYDSLEAGERFQVSASWSNPAPA